MYPGEPILRKLSRLESVDERGTEIVLRFVDAFAGFDASKPVQVISIDGAPKCEREMLETLPERKAMFVAANINAGKLEIWEDQCDQPIIITGSIASDDQDFSVSDLKLLGIWTTDELEKEKNKVAILSNVVKEALKLIDREDAKVETKIATSKNNTTTLHALSRVLVQIRTYLERSGIDKG